MSMYHAIENWQMSALSDFILNYCSFNLMRKLNEKHYENIMKYKNKYVCFSGFCFPSKIVKCFGPNCPGVTEAARIPEECRNIPQVLQC